MSTETDANPQIESETDESAQGTAADIFTTVKPLETEADDPVDSDKGDETDLSIGEWSLCASMIFLAGYLVVIMLGILGHPVWDTLTSFELEVYSTKFPVGIATILLLISVVSTFCSFISLVADKNNRKTLLIRILTLGPVLPTFVTCFMIWIIVKRGPGNSILENFLG